jgi:hypothetical protein
MLMDLALSYNLSPKVLQAINICRIYLQVLTLSDISSANGTTLLSEVLDGQRPLDRSSTLHWMNPGETA